MLAPSVLAMLIPIIAVVMSLGLGMLGLYLNYRKRQDMFAMYHQERMAAIDKGIELPPLPDAFFSDDKKPYGRSPHRHLLIGLILTLAGGALMLALRSEDEGHFLWGLIPAVVGLAFLIYYFAVGRKEALALQAAAIARSAGTPPAP